VSDKLISFIRDYFKTAELVPLHVPVFQGRELEYVTETIKSTFVSSVGTYVDRFEHDVETYTGAPKAVATVNGTSGLHLALRLAGVETGDLVITQPLTFVATCNAISYCGAQPVFVDVDMETLGLSPLALRAWLEENAFVDDDKCCRAIADNRYIKACVPMHTFGHPAKLDELLRICEVWGLTLVEDAAESLGSFYKNKHTGTYGTIGVLSFNGNKIVTTGGGGMILADKNIGAHAKHLTTTAKQPHPYEYVHDEVGYNYRMPNLNAALGCAQLELLESFVKSKRELAKAYQNELRGTELEFVSEPKNCRSNYWLNAVICEDLKHRNTLLEATNRQGVMTRPIWALMNHLNMFRDSICGDLRNSEWLEARVVNLPSSVSEAHNVGVSE
jgi:aminotransferase in exopolysaccharide biosynthesis